MAEAIPVEVLNEAQRRYPPSMAVEAYDEITYKDDEYGYDECQRAAFINGAQWGREQALKDILPEGAEWFPVGGGIQWHGELHFPADYILSRSDIQAIRERALAEGHERRMRQFTMITELREQLAARDAVIARAKMWLQSGQELKDRIGSALYELGAAPESVLPEPLIECPHWEPGHITLRHGCTACAADAARNGTAHE